MAVNVTNKKLPNIRRFTLGGALIATEVTVPDTTGTISFRPDGTVRLSFVGTDGQAFTSAHYATLTANEWTTFKWAALDKRNTSRNTFYLVGPSGGEIVELVMQD